jgi:hypothetical protein
MIQRKGYYGCNEKQIDIHHVSFDDFRGGLLLGFDAVNFAALDALERQRGQSRPQR